MAAALSLTDRLPARVAGGVVAGAGSLVPAHERCFPVDELLAPLLPDAGLPRGRLVGCTGSACWSLALALAGRAVTTGSWLAIVGAPAVGLEAAAELGVRLDRVVVVAADRTTWAERVAAAADGFDLIVTTPPPGAERIVRRVQQRLQARGSVLLAVGHAGTGVACDIELATTAVRWVGIGRGAGHLMARRATVRSAGRRMPRPIERELLLPGPNGRIRAIDGSAGETAGETAGAAGLASADRGCVG
jgi:hypothetical protein